MATEVFSSKKIHFLNFYNMLYAFCVTFILQQFVSLISLLNSEKGATALASGFALGFLAGIVPSNFLILMAVFFVLCVFRIHGGAFFFSWAVWKILVFPFDPLLHKVGLLLLTHQSMQKFFTYLYNLPIVPWSHFNNTVMAGSLIMGLVLFFPVLLISRLLIFKYRETLLFRYRKSKLYLMLKTTTIYKMYEKYNKIKGAVS